MGSKRGYPLQSADGAHQWAATNAAQAALPTRSGAKPSKHHSRADLSEDADPCGNIERRSGLNYYRLPRRPSISRVEASLGGTEQL
jgi:hypothetical protein